MGSAQGCGLRERPRVVRVLGDLLLESDIMMPLRRATLVYSCSTSDVIWCVCTAAVVGVATSMILSASWATSSRPVVSGVDTHTDIRRKSLKEQFMKKGFVNGASFVAQKLLHAAQDLAWFAIA